MVFEATDLFFTARPLCCQSLATLCNRVTLIQVYQFFLKGSDVTLLQQKLFTGFSLLFPYEIIKQNRFIYPCNQELDVSIANLSVQIFTVPSVAHHLIEKQDCLTKMVEYFTQIFEDEAKYQGKVNIFKEQYLHFQTQSFIFLYASPLIPLTPCVESRFCRESCKKNGGSF